MANANGPVAITRRSNQSAGDADSDGDVGSATAVAPSSSGGGGYVVQPGDTLWSISQKFNTTVVNLRSWNSIRHNRINIGDKLKIYTP